MKNTTTIDTSVALEITVAAGKFLTVGQCISVYIRRVIYCRSVRAHANTRTRLPLAGLTHFVILQI